MIETPKGNLSRGMRQLNSIYSQKFNRKYKRIGHLFEGRFRSILVEEVGGKSRDEIIFQGYNEYDFTMKEIGDFLGVHYSTVSRAVKEYESKK